MPQKCSASTTPDTPNLQINPKLTTTQKNQIGAEVLIVLVPENRQHQAHEQRKQKIDEKRHQENLVKKLVFFGRVDELLDEIGPVQEHQSRRAPHQRFENLFDLLAPVEVALHSPVVGCVLGSGSADRLTCGVARDLCGRDHFFPVFEGAVSHFITAL